MAESSADEIFQSLFSGINQGSEVGDISDFRKTLGGNDYWRMAAAPLLGARFDTRTWSPGEALGATAGSAFLGAVLNALGQRSEASQIEKAVSVLPDLYKDPLSVQAPEGVDPEAFAGLKANILSRSDRARSGVLSKIAEDLYKTKLEEDKSKLQEKGKIEGRREGYSKLGTEDPEDPLVKQKRSLEADTYARIVHLPSYTQFTDIDANFRTLKSLAEKDDRPSSIGMISALARIWDPMGTVREGEYQINSQAQSALDSVVGNWRELILGKGKLSEEAKRTIIGAASQKYNEFGNKYLTERNSLYDALKQQGGVPTNVPTPGYEPFDINNFKIPVSIDTQAAKRDATLLRAEGKSPAEVAAILRKKYGG